MALSRRVLGQRSNFRVVGRQTPGAQVVGNQFLLPQNLSDASGYTAEQSAFERYRQQALQSQALRTQQGGTVLGHAGLQAGHQPYQTPGERLWPQVVDYYANDPTTQAIAGAVDPVDIGRNLYTGFTGNTPPGDRISDHWIVDENIYGTGRSDFGSPSPDVWKRGSGRSWQRGGLREAIRNAAGANPDRDTITAAIEQAYFAFEEQRAQYAALKKEALADGQAEVAAQYDRQIRDLERNIDEFNREIKVSGDVESWFRDKIQAPFEAAKQAALDVNYQPTLALRDESAQRVDDEMQATQQRIDAALLEAGLTPEKLAAVKAGAAQENAIAAAQLEVLNATAIRPGQLEFQKQLAFHTADALRLSNMRKSAGDEFVTSEVNRRRIAEAKDMIGEISREKSEALARVKRAVERTYGEGPLLPTRDEIVGQTLDTIFDSLGADMPPGAREYYMSVLDTFLGTGATEFDEDTFIRLVREGAIPNIDEDVLAAMERAALQYDTGEITKAEYESRVRNAASNAWDAEDRAIMATLISGYHDAAAYHERLMESAYTGSQGNRTSGAGAGNRVWENRVAAEAGEGPYGQRATYVASLGDYFRNLGYRVEQWRDWDDVGREGTSKTSDHYTGGALDIYVNSNDPDAMADYNSRIRPMLENLYTQGKISYILHPGHDKAHADHVHISFPIEGAAHHGNVSTVVGSSTPTGTATYDGGRVGGR